LNTTVKSCGDFAFSVAGWRSALGGPDELLLLLPPPPQPARAAHASRMKIVRRTGPG